MSKKPCLRWVAVILKGLPSTGMLLRRKDITHGRRASGPIGPRTADANGHHETDGIAS